MLSADTLKDYHASPETEFMWWGKNFFVPYFIIHAAFVAF